MPQQLEYDEQGSTFYYFLISFYGLVLLPATYFLWPYKKKGKLETVLVWGSSPALRVHACRRVSGWSGVSV
jgi:preprotein translocase subunit Sec63